MSAYQEYFDANHQLLRDSVRRFVEREILPFVAEWEEAESFPRELYAKAGAAGILGIGYPEQFGGSHEGDEALHGDRVAEGVPCCPANRAIRAS